MRRVLVVAMALHVFASGVSAQTDPLTLPRLDLSGVSLGTSITFDWPDGAGGDLSYGPGAIGVSEDGKFVYVGCNLGNPKAGIAKLAIPANGGPAKVVAPCQGPDQNEIKKIVPGWGAGAPMIGGILEQGGRVVVSAFGSYDANGAATASHWSGPSLTQLTGPFRATVPPGLVKGLMGTIPQEWRGLLGGPAFATSGYTSIISRQSTGAVFVVFDPATVTANDFPATLLLGCPYWVSQKCASRWTSWGVSSDYFEGAELAGGSFIVPGTRTLVVIEREAIGQPLPGTTSPRYEGYGYATNNQSFHGQPYPSPEGVRYIYSPSDPANQKGNKGGEYKLVAKLYDLADLVAVKAGTKKPEDIDQYATVTLPGSRPNEFVSGGAYNPVTGEFYLLRGLGGGVNTIHVLKGWGAPQTPPPPPTDVDCDGTWSAWTRVPGSETACQGGTRYYSETQTYTVTTQPQGNGAACPSPLTRTQQTPEPCQMPTTDVTCWVTGQGTSYADGDRRPVIRCDTNGPAALVIGQTFTLKKQ